MVRLACKAKYGYEYLFVEISKEFNLKVDIYCYSFTNTLSWLIFTKHEHDLWLSR